MATKDNVLGGKCGCNGPICGPPIGKKRISAKERRAVSPAKKQPKNDDDSSES